MSASSISWWARTWLLRDGMFPTLGSPLLLPVSTLSPSRPLLFALALVISEEVSQVALQAWLIS